MAPTDFKRRTPSTDSRKPRRKELPAPVAPVVPAHPDAYVNPEEAAAAAAAPAAPTRRVLTTAEKEQLATKLEHDLRRDILRFNSRVQVSFEELDEPLAMVPVSYLTQHFDEQVQPYRSYLPSFLRAASGNHVLGYMRWAEWASGVASRHKTGERRVFRHNVDAAGPNMAGLDATKAAAKQATRTRLGETLKSREHVKALLAMCHRPSQDGRREGVYALVHLLQGHLEDMRRATSIQQVKDGADPSAAYALSRLVHEMASEHFTHVVLNCSALHQVLRALPMLHPGVVLSLLENEMAMRERMAALEKRHASKKAKAGSDDEEEAAGSDADSGADIDDATRGERHQKATASLFALVAMLTVAFRQSPDQFADDDARLAMRMLCYCFIEARGFRMLAATLLLKLLQFKKLGTFMTDRQSARWIAFTFFRVPEIEYLRPEGMMVLLTLQHARIMGADYNVDTAATDAVVAALPEALRPLVAMDPLEPAALEQIAVALFRRDQVTAHHPIIHPVFEVMLRCIQDRCAHGESLKEHASNFLHNVVLPFRRGIVDAPRTALVRDLIRRVGRMALLSSDEQDRASLIDVANRTVGFGASGSVGKASDPGTLRRMPVAELVEKIGSLVRQLQALAKQPRVGRVRTWILRELKACAAVPQFSTVDASYVSQVADACFDYGLTFCKGASDAFNQNKALYVFAELLYSSTKRPVAATQNKLRPVYKPAHATLVQRLLNLEAQRVARFYSAVGAPTKGSIAAARKSIADLLTQDAAVERRSVLFFATKPTLDALLLLLFITISIDDPENDFVASLAESVVPDLVHFARHGTLDNLPVLYDVLMALSVRDATPMQVLPLALYIRRLALDLMVYYARFIKDRATLDMVLSPLIDAFNTDAHEAQRRLELEARRAKDASGLAADLQPVLDADAAAEAPQDDSDDATEEDEDDATEADDATDADAATEADEESGSEAGSSDGEGSDEGSAPSDDEASDDEEWAKEGEDERPTEEYIERLKRMLKGSKAAAALADDEAASSATDGAAAPTGITAGLTIQHVYPPAASNKDKTDVNQAISTVQRVCQSVRNPIIIRAFQVLLAVMRENVKAHDEVVFDAAVAAIESMLVSRNRYFGHFVEGDSPVLLSFLRDVVGYIRRQEDKLVSKKDESSNRNIAELGAMVRRRMLKLKRLALTTLHFIGYLAYKNHAPASTRVTLLEHYRTLLMDRGWEEKQLLGGIKRDMFHFRHAFAWCFLDAAVEKFTAVRYINAPRRARYYVGVAHLLTAFMPRMGRLPLELKQRASATITGFLKAVPFRDLYAMKNTLLYEFCKTLQFAAEYKNHTSLDAEWARAVANEIVDADELKTSSATLRALAKLERALQMAERAVNVKHAEPVQQLHKQTFAGAAEQALRGRAKAKFYREARQTENAALQEILRKRNRERTHEEVVETKKRRMELRAAANAEKDAVKKAAWDALTADEKDEARGRRDAAKQQRIARNREHRREQLQRRNQSLTAWRDKKLAGEDSA